MMALTVVESMELVKDAVMEYGLGEFGDGSIVDG